MKPLFFVLSLCVASFLEAQNGGEKILIKAGTDPKEVLTPDKIYRFPNFTRGTVFFRDGSQINSLLNYNFLNGEIEFISSKGDTLAIAKNQQVNIKNIQIDSVSFYFDNGYLEQIMHGNNGRLLSQQLLVRIKREKIGAYDQPSETGVSDSYLVSFDFDPLFQSSIKSMENITLQRKARYFFADQYNLILPATKKNLTKVFAKQKEKIEEYLKTNPVDFKKHSDIHRLFAYIQTL